MKTFEKENHYQILQVHPNADPDEIRHAYREALAVYGQDSTATYALFSDVERRALLNAIEQAYAVLIDPEQRAGYDQKLIDTGQVSAAVFSQRTQRRLAARVNAGSATTEESLNRWVAGRAQEPKLRELIDAIMSNDRLSGPDLRRLREAYGIELSEMFAVTRINSDVLKRIEADRFDELPARVYMRQFLRNYAEILHIDPDLVIERYLAAMDSDRTTR